MVAGTSGTTGRLAPVPVIAATSRATPISDRQSARFGVSFSVNRRSSRSRKVRIDCPTGASSGSTSRPEASSAMPSSLAEHSMPEDSMPRTFATLIVRSPDRRAPGSAHGTLRPTATFGAPQTICFGAPSPVSTRQTFRRSASGCLATSSTWATTTSAKAGATVSSSSTSRPAIVSRWASSSLDRRGSTKVRNQDSENFM